MSAIQARQRVGGGSLIVACLALAASAGTCAAQVTLESDKGLYALGESVTLSYSTPDEFPPPHARRFFYLSTHHLLPVADGRFSIEQELRANQAGSYEMDVDESWLRSSIPVEPWYSMITERGSDDVKRAYYWVYRDVPAFPGAIQLDGAGVSRPGRDVRITISDVPRIKAALEAAHVSSHLTIVLYRLGERVLGGSAITDALLEEFEVEPAGTPLTVPWDEIQLPGRYELRLNAGNYELDRAAFEVRLPDVGDVLSITPGSSYWPEEVIADPGALPPNSQLEYFRIGREGDRQPADSFYLEGLYEAQIRWAARTYPQQRTFILDAETFAVTTGEAPPLPDVDIPYGAVPLQLVSGDVMAPGETVAVSATIPTGLDLSTEPLWFDVVKIGGYQPDCARVADESVMYPTHADLSQPFVFPGPEWPGVYEVRLYLGGSQGISLLGDRHPDLDPLRRDALYAQLPYAELVAKVSFRVELGMIEGALVLENGSVFQSGEPIRLRYDLPPKRLPRGDDFLSIVRLPEIVPGGAINAPSSGDYGEKWSFPGIFTERQGSLELGEAWLPGTYEVRIYDRYPGALAYARTGFTVENRDLPPLPDGFVRATRSSDWPREETPAMLSPEPHPACVAQPAEAMRLAFSHWQEGKIVPLEGGIDYGDAFYVEGRLDAPAIGDVYEVDVEPAGTEPMRISLRPVEGDPTLLRSELLYVVWDVSAYSANSGGAQ